MIITIKANNKYHTYNYVLSDDVRKDLINIFDYVYYKLFDKGDEIFIWAINNNEYYELNKIITMYMEDMENEERPMWFDSMLLIALIKAKYEYLYRGYDFDNYDDDYNFDKFKKSRGLE